MDAGAHPKIVSRFHGMRKSSTGEELETDKSHITTGSIMYDALYIPSGEKHLAALMKEGDALHFINEAFKHGKAIATRGNGIALFGKAAVPGVATFTTAFIDAIKEHRHWDRELKMMVPA